MFNYYPCKTLRRTTGLACGFLLELKLLEALGGECAGLITITNEENPELERKVYEFNSENYEELSDDRIAEYIRKNVGASIN